MVDVIIPRTLGRYVCRYGDPTNPRSFQLWRDDAKGLFHPSVIEIQLAFEIVAAVLAKEGERK